MRVTNAEMLRGRRLRYAVAVLLHEARDTVGLDDLAARLEAWGYATTGEPRKAISDALRWELHQGRALRVRRGHYRSRGLHPSTWRWMRAQVTAGPGRVH